MIRNFLFKIWFILSIAIIGIIGAPIAAISKKLGLRVSKIWGKTVLFGLKYIRGISLEVKGLENIADGKVLVAAKHLSTLDTVAPYIIFDGPCFIFKKELFKIPVFGWYLKQGGHIGIDRDGGMKALKSMVAEARERLEEGRTIIIFPEGTRQELDAAPDYKPGVAAIYGMLNVPCVPLALNTGYYWPAKGFPNKSGIVTFEFGKAIEPGIKRQEFMSALETSIEERTKALIIQASNKAIENV